MEENFPQQPSDPGSRMSLTEIARAIANKTGMAYNEVLTEVLRQGQIPSAWNLGTTGISMLISNIVNKLKGKGMAGGGPIYEAADQAAAIRNAIEDVWNSGHGVTKQAVWEALRGQNIPPSRFANIAHARRHYARDDRHILELYGYT